MFQFTQDVAESMWITVNYLLYQYISFKINGVSKLYKPPMNTLYISSRH